MAANRQIFVKAWGHRVPYSPHYGLHEVQRQVLESKVSALPTVGCRQDGAISYRLFDHASYDCVHAHMFRAQN